MATVRQTNFGAGELAPLYHGRTDLELFSKGLKTCRNFFIARSGAAVSRPGSTFVREAKNAVGAADPLDPDGLDAGRVRLIPYIYSDARSFVLELGNGYLRVHTLGRTVMNGAVPYEVPTKWPAFVLPFIKYAQSGAVMTLTVGGSHKVEDSANTPPMELTIRVNPATGAPTIEIVGVDSRPFLSDWFGLATIPTKPLSPPAPIFADVDVPANLTTNFAVVTGSVGATDATHPDVEWQWLITAVIQDPTTGATYETKGERVVKQWDGSDYAMTAANLPDDKWPLYSDRAITLKRAARVGGDVPPWKILAYFVYRGRGGVFGFVGSTEGREFIDTGAEPDYAKQPPLGGDPFLIKDRLGAISRREYPRSVAFFENRRVWGGTNGGTAGVSPAGARYGKPATLFCSSNTDYYDHDKRLAKHVSGEALEYALAALQREEITHLVSRERLVVLTDSKAWTFGGTGLEPLDFDSINAHPTDDVGSSHVMPVVIDSVVLFVRRKGFGARALLPIGRDSQKPYVGRDVSEQAQHLFVGSGTSKEIRDWCYAEDPWGVVWAVRGDGALLSFTPTGESAVAWARHDSEGSERNEAYYESVCSVPEGEEDAVYVVVRRKVNGGDVRYVERLTSRVRRVKETDASPLHLAEPTADDTNQLYPTDVCLDCAMTYAGAPAFTIDSADLRKLWRKQVYVVAKSLPVLGPFTVQGNGGVIGNPATGMIDLSAPDAGGQGLGDAPGANAIDEMGVPIFVCRIGLKYTCDLETLAIRGAIMNQQKTIAEVGFELDNAQGVQCGQDFDHLDDWMQREVSDSYQPISAANTLLYTVVDNTWDKNARVVLRQSEPRPVTVVGIAREVVTEKSGDL